MNTRQQVEGSGTRTLVRCERCSHQWLSRIDPVRCARCRSPYWRTKPNAGNGKSRPRSIEEEMGRIAAEVPPGEWAKVPADLALHHDHYLYGSPRVR